MASRLLVVSSVIAGAVVADGAALYGVAVLVATPDSSRLYRACITGDWPDEDDARQRSEACSQALQTRRLRPDKVALAA